MAKQFTLHSAEAYSVLFQMSEAVVWRCSVEKVFLEISQNSHKKACARVSFFSKVTGQRPATLLKKRLWHRSFPVTFAKFLRAPFFTEHLRWLLLKRLSKNLNHWKTFEITLTTESNERNQITYLQS